MTGSALSHGFGRVVVPDDRDKNFPLRALLAPEPLPQSKFWWASGWWGDQGLLPHCVEYSWHHWCCDGPTMIGRGPLWTPGSVYNAAQKIDDWPGEAYEGTSVRAGAKVLAGQGRIASYHWAWDIDTVVSAVLLRGPVVVGTNWYASMMYPNAAGLVRVDGPVMGGHAYLLDGYSRKTGLFRIKNSWGRKWGRKGFAVISHDDMARLIDEGGEACMAVKPAKK